MFTGIIEAVKPILSTTPAGGKTYLQIARPDSFTDIKSGSSIAVNGICLTVLDYNDSSFKVEIMTETMAKTTTGFWKKGDLLNLERALSINGRLDGHWVQGHVDKITALLEKRVYRSTQYLTFALDSIDLGLMVKQGSIAVNGVSLTIAKLMSNRFSVALIGHTTDNTNLSNLQIGNQVNLEFDLIGKYLLQQKTVKRTRERFMHE